MKIKFGVKQIVLLAVALILIGVLIAGNIILQQFSPLLHGYFGGIGGNTDSEEAQKALGTGDQVVQEIAEDSMVLLKNEKVTRNGAETDYLPLNAGDYPDDAHGINLFGWGATDQGFLLVGGGSGGSPINESNPMHTPLTEAFEKQNVHYNKELSKAYSDHDSTDADYRGKEGSTNAYVDPCLSNPAASFYTQERMTQAKNSSKDAIVVLSRWGAENMDNNSGGELKNTVQKKNGTFLELTNEETAMFNALQEYGFDVTVLLNTTNPLELQFLEQYDCIKACLYVGIPGQSGAMAIPNLLFGSKMVEEDGSPVEVQISPSGRLSDTYAYSWQENSPSYASVGLTGNIAYKEGIYVGYKWYETAGYKGNDGQAQSYFEKIGTSYEKVVQFPFGYGLSYTQFTQTVKEFKHGDSKVNSGAQLEQSGDYTVTVTVKNTGTHAGKEVVQLYFTAPYTEGGIEKSSIELLAFGKTGLLQPGEEEDVTLSFTAYDMASYDFQDKNQDGFKGYELDNGLYTVKLMQNAHEPIAGQAYEFNVSNTIKYENDPVTGTKVENLFTGDTAYAGVPVDGSNALNGGVEYLSRAGTFANFHATETGIGAPTTAADNAHNHYVYDGYNTQEIRDKVDKYTYGANGSLFYLMTLEDGTAASFNQLGGAGANSEKMPLLKSEYVELFAENWDDPMWDMLLDQLTKDEIKKLIGRGGFHTEAVESIGKPRNFDTDGPAGYNSSVASPGQTTGWTVFPAETLSGCSWNTQLMYDLGRVQGQIGTASGVQGWYAPGVNLHRSPYNSRNYEYYSEDGVLSGHMAAATIKGAKEENVYCYLKHFALAESGQNSNQWNTYVTEQALREEYCKPFEIAVKEGGANAMMSAFNCVGAVWSGYNHALLTTMLREEWGFKGSVITDWYQGYMNDYGRAVIAGNDLWLNSTDTNANINFDDPAQAYAAIRSCKNIIYTYIDTLNASGQTTQVAASAPYSPLFVGLWATIDVVLCLGIVACALFFFWSPRKKAATAETAPDTAEPAETHVETMEQAEPHAETMEQTAESHDEAAEKPEE